MILDKDISPEKLKGLSAGELKRLCFEIRRYMIETVPKTGGHLASNLGTVELIVALHRVYSSPKDKIIFDVGHQAYTHKILTGRYERFSSLRSEGGISGFPRPSESEHDVFIGGHSGISVSAALGIAEAMRLNGDRHKAIAVAGDGAFTGGGIYEGLNNAGKSKNNLLVILNDNKMSISKSAGAIAAYLSRLRSTRKYLKAKYDVKKVLNGVPLGKEAAEIVSRAKKFAKNAIYQSNLFENLGFKYYGPVDGHNLKELIEVFSLAKLLNEPCLIHVRTVKGKGYKPAEQNSGEYHGLDKPKNADNKSRCFSQVFGAVITELGEADKRVCLISAAMKYATGCNRFNDRFPERFFDVGIAESHAVTFAAGLAAAGMIPVFAVYSTFAQRCFDQLVHDVAIENLHVVLAIDRAGVVGEDGETHQGVYDAAMFGLIPGFTVFSPSNAQELKICLEKALFKISGPVAVRYPRGVVPESGDGLDVDYIMYKNSSDKLIVTYGRLTDKALKSSADVLKLIKIQPLPDKAVEAAAAYGEIAFYEEGIERGGIGEAFISALARNGWKGKFSLSAVNAPIPCADVNTQLKNAGLEMT